MPELQTCPDRAHAPPGPFGPGENLDQWDIDRWTKDPEVADKEIREFMDKNPRGGISTNLWKSELPVPRTCSYCGGIHPEDAIMLFENGWEVESTGKDYKRYLNPPGYYNHGMRESGFWHPRPPVKLYVAHFSQDQIDRFNRAIKR